MSHSPEPIYYAIGLPFWSRLALLFPDPRDREQWQLEGHDDDIGRLFIDHWHELFEIPDKDPMKWRRVAVTARLPFEAPGWVLYDGRLGADGVVEFRNVQYRRVELARPD